MNNNNNKEYHAKGKKMHMCFVDLDKERDTNI